MAFIEDLVYLTSMLIKSGVKCLYFWWVYIYLVVMHYSRSFYYLFHVEFIKSELTVLDREVSLSPMPIVNHGKCYRFKYIREYYKAIYQLCGTTNCTHNPIVQWSNVVSILLSFLLEVAQQISYTISSNWVSNPNLSLTCQLCLFYFIPQNMLFGSHYWWP